MIAQGSRSVNDPTGRALYPGTQGGKSRAPSRAISPETPGLAHHDGAGRPRQNRSIEPFSPPECGFSGHIARSPKPTPRHGYQTERVIDMQVAPEIRKLACKTL